MSRYCVVRNGSKVEGAKQTALLEAIQTKSLPLVQLLIDRKADVNKAARLGLKHTPLQKACEVGSYPIVCRLLDYGAKVNGEPAAYRGGTALQFAAKSGSLRIAEHLLSLRASASAPPSLVSGHSAIEYAAIYGRIHMIQMLCTASGVPLPAEQYENAITLAKENGHRACADLLLKLREREDLTNIDYALSYR